MQQSRHQYRLAAGFFILSLLVHLLLLLIPESGLFPSTAKPEPVYVEVRPPQQRDRELDLPVRPELEQPRETPAQRLGPADQVVEQEMAPEGRDTEDQRPAVSARPAPPQPPATAKAETPPTPPQRTPAAVAEPEPARPVTPDGELPQPTIPQAQRQTPDLQQLTRISPDTLAGIDRDWRQKYRDEVLKGDTVWLDTEHDLLISFMKRFRDNIYMVWNYPSAAAQQGQEGTCLLRITVDRQGDVVDVRLLESSGHPSLDEEAIRAVRKGATYGPLPRAYPHEQLNIMAFFKYNLSRTSVIRRPGYLY